MTFVKTKNIKNEKGMRFGKSTAKCACEISGGGGFVKIALVVLLPIAAVTNLLVIIYPIDAWLSPFDEFRVSEACNHFKTL